MKRRMAAFIPALLLLLLLLVTGAHSNTQITQAAALNSPQPAASPLTVYALDIGQGDSLLIVSPDGKTVLVDTGNPGYQSVILNALEDTVGEKRIDLFIASHPHADHIGSAVAVFAGSTVARVLDSGFNNPTPTYRNFLRAVRRERAQYIEAAPGQRYDIGGGAVITVLAPIKPFFRQSELRSGGTTPNANSVVFRLDYNDFSMIFTGDAEAESEARMITRGTNLQADILKVGHHGARYATSNEFLEAVKPEAALISAGSANRYGHPTNETLRRLRDAGVKVYRTDLQGEITITSNGRTYEITTKRRASDSALFRGRG